MNTGEDLTALRKIVDFTRYISIFILSLHFYLSCYVAFESWGWTSQITNRIIANIAKTWVFSGFIVAKFLALICLIISVFGIKGKIDEAIRIRKIVVYLMVGVFLYFSSVGCFYLNAAAELVTVTYIGSTLLGYLLILSGGSRLSRLIKDRLNTDVFNSENETFPQQEQLLENEYSINLPAKYRLKDQIRASWINIINPFRGILIAGSPGAGKSYFVIRHIIDQHLAKGFSMFVYDFKYDDLSKITYNKLLKYYPRYQIKPKFYIINFDDLSRTHRCNPLDPVSMEDITDATEASRTIMMGLNRDWIKKQGDFFVESPINFLTSIIWYLRCYENGKYCTLPHVIELMQVNYDQLFAILVTCEEIQVLINPFISAYQNNAKAQLEGQIASAKIGLARLASPQLYYVLSGNDFTLDLNNPLEPKIVCMGNNPQKQQTYGAVLSLYISKMIKLVNRKGQLKSSLVFDEFPSIFLNGTDSLLATCRSNLISVSLAVQSLEQIRKDYGTEQAAVITGIVGNIISGQVTGDTAKKFSENFGRIMQDRETKSFSSTELSISKSLQLESAIPASKIATLSSGEFVGILSDNPDQKMKLKMFHCEIQNDHKAIKQEEAVYQMIPVVENVTSFDVEQVYQKIKTQIRDLVATELQKLTDQPSAVDKEPEEKQEVKAVVNRPKRQNKPKKSLDQINPI
ncbi:conjugal transfer protein TraG [Pedobacter sp. PACM 27299]|uniref:conjugal transfer protein MobC n=1 Tax=Pedobacter sp. PACM 27299 TaxID=1727164 RepID=UPI0007068BE5|nr:conjugal transfer protein MobC [Pedobacter sp. PACM 27299]ALL07018.1 conjugal transfer protein TraG [Pedobacter sp. PACM 27299]